MLLIDLELPPDAPETDERCRSIERGARLITAIPSSSSVVLQMPRGNIETIYPRAMVLAGIRQNIDTRNYKAAFLTCRSQRVDMNILHDYAPETLLENVSLFIKQVGKPEYIDLFLSQLRLVLNRSSSIQTNLVIREEDVSQVMYIETIKGMHRRSSQKETDRSEVFPSKDGAVTQESKINRICNAFLIALNESVSTHLQNILTAYVCKSPPALDDALKVVSNLRGELIWVPLEKSYSFG